MGADSSGTIDPTEYFYDEGKGLLTRVKYDNNASREAEYFYDGAGQLTKLTDWIDGTDGLRYGYDDVGRLTKITDYDGSNLDYFYDDAGRVTKMTDYHNNDTTYTYTDTGQISTITAPGSKVWTWTYNAAGAPTQYTHPNGMTTEYAYDDDGRQTKISHKDGVNVVQSFEYATDPVGNITKTTHEDGSWWEYEYDGRNRLTTADRHNKATPTITAAYAYTYDDGDNMLTKIIPWEDDFEDGTVADDGWSVHSGTWSVVNGAATNTKAGGGSILQLSQTDGTAELVFSARVDSSSDSGYQSRTAIRYQNGGEKIELRMAESGLSLYQLSDSTWTLLDSSANGLSTDTWYEFRADMDGADIEVWMRERDGSDLFSKELETASATVLVSNNVNFDAQAGSVFGFDDVRVLADSMSRTVTYSHNNGNELTSMADYNGTISFAYDAWGRQTSKTRGSHSVAYTWGYGSKLTQVDSDFPGQGTVDYRYGGDQKRRERDVTGGEYTWYNWDIGWNVLNEEGSAGTLQRTFFGRLGYVDGSNPSSGSYRYFISDRIGSTRALHDQSKSRLGFYEYTPYGNADARSTSDVSRAFTGHDWDAVAKLYFAPYRYYSPVATSWLSRDPLGARVGLNLYAYVSGNPIRWSDRMGLCANEGCSGECLMLKPLEIETCDVQVIKKTGICLGITDRRIRRTICGAVEDAQGSEMWYNFETCQGPGCSCDYGNSQEEGITRMDKTVTQRVGTCTITVRIIITGRALRKVGECTK